MSELQESHVKTPREKMLLDMEQDLASCRASIVASVVARNLYQMALNFVVVVIIFATAEIVASLVQRLSWLYPRLATVGEHTGVVLVIGIPAVVCLAILRILQERPSLCETAERLDLAVDDHNRIATAWWLIHGERQGPLVEAAIDDGLAHLKLFKGSTPDRSGTWPKLAEYRPVFIVAGVLVALAILLQPERPRLRGTENNPAGQVAVNHEGVLPAEVIESLKLPLVERKPPVAQDPPTSADENVVTASEMAKKLLGSDKETEGTSGSGKSSAAQSSSNASSANSTSSDSSSEAKGDLKKKSDPKPKKANKKKPNGQTKTKEKQENQGGSSSVSQGSSGGGSMLAVQHDWAQQAQTADPEDDTDLDDDEEVDNENEENSQRGGVQPTLKDRNESPSRELSISEGGDKPGNGRGGPSPPKKSRGTASLVLGVPMPDFVRGRLSAGPTKITQERVRPVPMQSDPSGSVAARRRAAPEPVVPRSNFSVDMLSLVREYLIELHKGGEGK